MTQYNLQYLTEISEIDEYHMMNYEQKKLYQSLIRVLLTKSKILPFFCFHFCILRVL